MVHIVPMYMKRIFLLRNKVFLALRGGKECKITYMKLTTDLEKKNFQIL